MLFIKYFDCGVGDGFLACGSDEPCYWPMVNKIHGKVGLVSIVKILVKCKYYFDCEMRDGFWSCGIVEPCIGPWYGMINNIRGKVMVNSHG